MVWECSVRAGASFYRAGGGRQGGEGGITAGNVVAFNGRVISGSSRRVKARLEGGSNGQRVKEEGEDWCWEEGWPWWPRRWRRDGVKQGRWWHWFQLEVGDG
jgi:hypothetical protein